MIEADMTCFRRMPSGTNARALFIPIPAALPRTMSEFALVRANAMSASMQAPPTRPRLTPGRSAVLHGRHKSAGHIATLTLRSFRLAARPSRLNAEAAEAHFNISADAGAATTPTPACFISGNTPRAQASA